MAKNHTQIDSSGARQQALFDSGIEEGEFDISLGLKQTIARDLKGFDRYLVAAQISKAMCKDISKDSLDKHIASDPAYQPGLIETAVICRITGSLAPFRYVLEQERIIKAKMDAIRSKRGLK